MPPNRHRRGRRRGRRWITAIPEITHFRPMGVSQLDINTIFLSMEELEAIRLVDLEGMDQQEAAYAMGVSRKTLWNDLKRGRKKVAEALINGYAIRIEGGSYALRGEIR